MQTVVGATFAFPFGDFEQRALAEAGDVFARNGALEPVAARFLRQLHEDAVSDDLESLTVSDMVLLAAQFWRWAGERAPDESQVRAYAGQRRSGDAIGRDILEIVTADTRFLVDSILGEISRQGIDVLALFHPTIAVERDEAGRRTSGGAPVRESMIQVHLEPLDEGRRDELIAGVHAVLGDVKAAVSDFSDMVARMDQAIDELTSAPANIAREERDECITFLRWLRNDHFAFLGCRVYEFSTGADGKTDDGAPRLLTETGRGVLRDPERHVLRRGSEPAIITPEIRAFLSEPTPLIISKSTERSRVHRNVYMDYVGVKRYRADGEVIGETRFVGLFTAEAYLARVEEAPLVRRKVQRVMERANLVPGGHNQKAFKNIIETYPRDELFFSSEDELLQIGLGILHLLSRPRTKLFIRRDRFDRYLSAFVFVPRERFNSELRRKIGDEIASAFSGRISAFYPSFSDGPLARVHFIIGLEPFDHPEPDIAALERRIVDLARTWEDAFEQAARASGGAAVRRRLTTYEAAFSAGYREQFAPDEAVRDVEVIEAFGPEQMLAARAYREADDAKDGLRLKLYRFDAAIPLAEILPSLEHLGLEVIAETAFPIRRKKRGDGGESEPLRELWIHMFSVRLRDGEADIAKVGPVLEEAIEAFWRGEAESDGFNRLISCAGVSHREVAFLRTCARFRQQTGLDPSQAVQEDALAQNAPIAVRILELKSVRFDPDLNLNQAEREAKCDEIDAVIAADLDAVASLDADRALRRIWRLVRAIVRTNFYQIREGGALPEAIAIKIASRELDELPAPKPFREIFVWAPHVEGVHIRFGAVARGGLRWSDRRDDFRTEVLGLVKAQVVKNSVIVPVGSKGGFYPKRLPVSGSRDDIRAEGVRSYRTFVSALLDVTDNLDGDAVTPPERVVRWDGDDPYLVVAADKGTATFSDIANDISAAHNFWLGDAFASGGSAGYDHKAMGITARSAWVSVQRHFRELGKDIQTEPFTVLGVGDMSGDVFGNGMLLSRTIKLRVAFNHLHIFIDPDPIDLEACFAERKRLFEMGRSSWADYDESLISEGGGVFDRSVKSIPLSPQMKAMTGLTDSAAPPNVLLNALLKADVELIWLGGIGTYVKASDEQHWEVGDRANDALRVDADEVRAKVIGEGANLGVTQAGRVALARHGVKLNADFIDNVGGVNSSDNEVNIKILLNPMVREGRMTLQERNALLESMTEDVAVRVLEDSYDQSLAISLAEADAPADLDAHERLIVRLEKRGQLNREVEGLPSAEDFRVLKEKELGLTRPELSLLVSYSKISLFDRILESTLPDDPHFNGMLARYFPPALGQYADEMANHRLKRELLATILANDLVNLGGPTFVHRAREATGGDTSAVARGFQAAREIFGFDALIKDVHALDNQAPATAQAELYGEIISLVRRQTYWLVRRWRGFDQVKTRSLDDTIAYYKPGVDAIRGYAGDIMSDFQREHVAARAALFVEHGAPAELAEAVSALRPLTSSSDVIDVAVRRSLPLKAVARLYHAAGEEFGHQTLRNAGRDMTSSEHWDRLAVRRLNEDLYADQQLALEALLDTVKGDVPDEPDAAWADEQIERFKSANAYEAARLRATLDELGASGVWTLAKITIATAALREFATFTRER